MAERPEDAGKSFDIDEEISSSSQSVLEVYSDMMDNLSQSIKKLEGTQSAFMQIQMTSTPKLKDTGHLSHLRQVVDTSYIPFPDMEKTSGEKSEGQFYDQEECDRRNSISTQKSTAFPFTVHKKHLSSDIFPEISSVNVDSEQRKSCQNYSRYHMSEQKDPFVSFEICDDQDQTFSVTELTEKHSETEIMESGLLETTNMSLHLISNGSLAATVTNVSQLTDGDLPKAKVPSLQHSSVLPYTTEAMVSQNLVDSGFWSSRNSGHLKCAGPSSICHEGTAIEQKAVNDLNLQKQLKKTEDNNISTVKDDGNIFSIQELESYLTKSDQVHMQEQRLKSKAAGVYMALKYLRINEQYLRDENFRYREQISRLKSDKNFLQLSLSKAEQDGEENLQEILSITDKCEELLKQRKHFQDERNRLSVEKQFLMKEIEELKRENKRKADQLALTTTEKERLVKMLNSTKKMLFTYVKEKEELHSRLKDALEVNSDLKRKINTKRAEKGQ